MNKRLGIFLILSVSLATGRVLAADCDAVISHAPRNAVITSATTVQAGAFTPPPGSGGPPNRPEPYSKLPAFCRVQASLHPTPDSDIRTEIWLPLKGWNGKLEAVGNGGWAGTIYYYAMAGALADGYATAGTDTGHTGGNADFAVGHPEKLLDFGPRSIHELALAAKAVVKTVYARSPRRSYFVGCSTGGRQGLQEAERHPTDFDGIVAGDPANNWSALQIGDVWMAHAAKLNEASHLADAQFALLSKAAIAACDAKDGVKDGVISDPLHCEFDPAVLQCQQGASSDCLTSAQVAAAKMLYSPVTNPRTGAEIHPRLLPGSELNWKQKVGGSELFDIPSDYFKKIVFKDPNWDWRKFDFDGDVATTLRVEGGLISALQPNNLRAFQAHGGKLIQYHGWADASIVPEDSIHYYQAAAKALGGADAIDQWYRLFMIPGMYHCGNGPGTSEFDMVAPLDAWVEHGTAPQSVPAAHQINGQVDRTRPLCPYPQSAQYKGSGSIDDAASFTCR
jgi:feruloyl esterase